MRDLESALEALVNEGEPRGAVEVLSAAKKDVRAKGGTMHNDGLRRWWLPLAAAAAAAVVVVAGLVVALGSGGDDDRRVSVGANDTAGTTTLSTTSPTTLPSGGTDRWSASSKMSLEGLGPIRLGMTLSEAAQAARASLKRSDGCYQGLTPEAGSGVEPDRVSIASVAGDKVAVIAVTTPSISTTAGIRVGSTKDELVKAYPNGVLAPKPPVSPVPTTDEFTPTGPDGRKLLSYLDKDVVRVITLYANREAYELVTRC